MRAHKSTSNETPMSTSRFSKLVGGLRDAAPAPFAPARHFRRLIYISIGISIAMLSQSRGSASPSVPAVSRIPLYGGLIVVELALFWFVVLGVRARGYKIADLFGQRWQNAARAVIDILCAIGTAALLRVLGPLLFDFLGRWKTETGFLLPKTGLESAVWIVVSIAAGVCEEAVYRGYLQRQLWSFTRSLPAALFLQSLIFGLAHIYQGWKPALVTAIYGLIFGIIAAWRRSILPGAIAHAVVDVMGGLRL
jgi:hypothetical protein